MSIRMSTKAALAAVFAIGSMQPLAAQHVVRGPKFHPNTQKYSDAGAKPVSGRAGSASLEARALYGIDGVVKVEASTGRLDDHTGPGQIRKVQMKIFSSQGKLLGTQSLGGSDKGYWTTSLDQAGAGSRLQLQANVGGIDGSRNDVVTVTVPVMREPDVAVDAVTTPARALAGAAVNVVATLSERNGDVGARANCMLSVDDQLVDQAHGIWIDAGQKVSCAFETRMTALGSHKVTVWATNISPDDFDPQDNSASTSIEILSPETPLAYSAQFTASDRDSYTHIKKTSSDGSFITETTDNFKRQSRSFTMTSTDTQQMLSFPVHARSALMADGAAVFDYTNDIDLESSQVASTEDCGVRIDGGFFLSVCNIRWGTPRIEVKLSSMDGRVTYFGSRFVRADGVDTYTENPSTDTQNGLGAYAVSSSVQPVVEVRDARGMTFVARPTVSLQSTPVNLQSSTCKTQPFTQITTCTDTKTTGTDRTGSANAGTQ